ncbi:MAG: LamG-like jellyroll fold domain-containing protein [Chitinophagales bacterium]
MTRGRSSGRIKIGNILLFFLLCLGIYYLFNKSAIDQQLIDAGVLQPKGEIEVVEDLDDVDMEVVQDPPEEVIPETPESPQWAILTEGVNEFYLDEINKFTVRSDEELGALVPVVMGKGVSIKTVDEAKGLYELLATKEGRVEINLFGDVDGKRGIIGAKSFDLVKRVGQKNSDYLWTLNSTPSDTLFIGKSNTVVALVAEVDSKDLVLEVDKGSATIGSGQAGSFDVKVESGETANIKLLLKKEGKKILVGEKIFTLIDLATIDKANLVAYYPFNDCTALESISGDKKGSVGINPACVPGVSNKAISFDGKDDYVVFKGAVNELLRGKNNFSISFYYAHDNYKSDKFSSLFNKRKTCDYSQVFNVGVSGSQLSVSLYGKAKPMEKQSVQVGITSKGWKHYVITRQNGTLKIFVNGKLANTANRSKIINFTNTAALKASATPCNSGHNTERLKGKLDELKFYEGVLTDTEITNLYQSIPLLPTPPQPADVDIIDNSTTNDSEDNDATNDSKKIKVGSACGTKILNQILFTSIENPVQIEVGDIPLEELLVEFDKQVIPLDYNEKFSVKPKEVGEKELKIFQNKNGSFVLLTSAVFQVKELPSPIPYVELQSGGDIELKTLQKATEMVAQLDLFDFETTFEINGFQVRHYSQDGASNTNGIDNIGAVFNSSVRILLSKAQKGDVYVFTDIELKETGRFGFARDLPSIAFIVE